MPRECLPDEARNAALRQFGGVEQIKEIAREQRVWRWADEFVQDLRFGARMLWRTPGFSILAILCLTLGIGTNAAVFSWIEGILIRPYPLVAHQDRMVALIGTTRGATEKDGLSYPDFLDLEKNSTLFESFIVDRITGTTLSIGDRAERASGGIVSANYFDALGVRPMLGRGFRPEEGDGRNAHPVTVISYLTWKNRYKGDPDIIGKTQYHERRSTHDHRRRAGKISRHLHRLLVQLLGADVDAGDIRFDRLQTGRPRRALD